MPVEPVARSGWQAGTPEPDDAGHYLPDEAWQLVVEGAAERFAQLFELPPGARAARRFEAPDRTITARSHGSVMKTGPRLGVIHSAETPLVRGYAYSIAANWFATKATTSATIMCDPAETIRLLPDNVVAYHCGPNGNGFTVGVEQAGRAAFTRAQWLTVDGRAQMGRVAQYMVECRARWGIPLRWATDAEIRRAKVDPSFRAGWCTHDDVRRVLGGTTHTDPGTGRYPKDVLMATAVSLDNPRPAPVPAVLPEPRTSGSAVTILGDDVPTVLQAAGRPPVLAIGGLFVELRSEEEATNALRAYNAGILDKTGKPAIETVNGPNGSDGKPTKIERPAPVWLTPTALADVIAQSQRAISS